ncbi:hypothetical protein SDC9_173799 [bioreactor metagenome]|uniref:Coenzyme PQQ synthesis protein D n=1 Tax=bioreactor metagenome TaxID=1076179 RepID=A0A645GI57_9ZZZZ
MRRLGDAAVVFDGRNGQTHVLPPEAVAVADWVAEFQQLNGRVSIEVLNARLCEEFGIDEYATGYRDLLNMLQEIGVLRA